MNTAFTITQGAHLGQMNTFGIDALCDVLITYDSVEALPQIDKLLAQDYAGMPVMHLGAGSNLLPAHDFHGVILKSNIKGIEQHGDSVRVGAAETFDELIEWTLEHRLYGLENLSLIPGEVGASAVQNIGAYGAEAADFILTVEGYNFSTHSYFTISAKDCRYAYRDSIFKHELKDKTAITHVTFKLCSHFTPNLKYAALAQSMAGTTPTADSIRQHVIKMRQEKLPDPSIMGNAGSFFMNPVISKSQYMQLLELNPTMPHYPAGEDKVKIPTAWLIEQCGWKGKKMGLAAVHDRQALVLVNLGGASGSEVTTLMNHIIYDVQQRFNITLHPEVNIL